MQYTTVERITTNPLSFSLTMNCPERKRDGIWCETAPDECPVMPSTPSDAANYSQDALVLQSILGRLLSRSPSSPNLLRSPRGFAFAPEGPSASLSLRP